MTRMHVLSLIAAMASLGFTITAIAAEPVGDKMLRQAEDSENVQFALTLPLQNQAELDQALKDIYNPKSQNFRHFMSSAEFNAKYAPSEATYASLKSFALKSGLAIIGEHDGHTVLEVSSNVGAVRSLFNVQMQWRQTSNGRQYLAPDAEPSSPSSLIAIGGKAAALNHKPLRAFIESARSTVAPNAGSGPTGPTSGDTASYEPVDIKTAYNLNGIQNGGMPVALFELSSATYSDAAPYAAKFGLNNPTLIQKVVDGGTTDTSGADEVMLDIDMVMAVSNPTSIYIYTGPNSSAGSLATYTQMADDNLVGQASTSWGLCESSTGQTTADSENTQFEKMAAEGMALFAASGDFYAHDCATPALAVNDPASQPYVTGTGGTKLITTSGQGFTSETAWYDAAPPGAGYNGFWGGGGGISTFWPIPSYQTGFTPADSQFSTTMRNVPDVALNSDPYTGYYIYCTTPTTCTSIGGYNAGWIPNIGGTSAAAPQFAATWSLISKGLGRRAGFANPTLYAIAKNTTSYALAFHDVPSGSSNGSFNTFSGYDNATGWGSYNGANLYSASIAMRNAGALIPIIDLLLSH
jgi:kumamolisin